MMRNYVQVGMHSRGRLDESTPKNIIGIATKNIRTCLAVIVVGKTRLSFMHADLMVSLDSIKAEIEWVGKPNKIILVANRKSIAQTIGAAEVAFADTESKSSITDLNIEKNWHTYLTEQSISYEGLNCDTETVFANLAGEVSMQQPPGTSLIPNPDGGLTNHINGLNSIYERVYAPAYLEFDCHHYSHSPELSRIVKMIASYLKTELKDKAVTLESVSIAYQSFDEYVKSVGKTPLQLTDECRKTIIRSFTCLLDPKYSVLKLKSGEIASNPSLSSSSHIQQRLTDETTTTEKKVDYLKSHLEQMNKDATLKYSKGDYKSAEPLFTTLLTHWEAKYAALPDDEEIEKCLLSSRYNLASVYLKRQEFAKAQPYFQQALVLAEKIKKKDPSLDITKYQVRKKECEAALDSLSTSAVREATSKALGFQ